MGTESCYRWVVGQETTAARVLRDPCLLTWMGDMVTTAACILRDPCLLMKEEEEARRWTAPTTTVVTTATRARAQSTQVS